MPAAAAAGQGAPAPPEAPPRPRALPPPPPAPRPRRRRRLRVRSANPRPIRERAQRPRPPAGRAHHDAEVVSAVLHVSAPRRLSHHHLHRRHRAQGGPRAHQRLSALAQQAAIVAYAIVGEMGRSPAPDTGTLRGSHSRGRHAAARAFCGPLGQGLAGLVAHMAHDAQLAQIIRRRCWRRDATRCAGIRARPRAR